MPFAVELSPFAFAASSRAAGLTGARLSTLPAYGLYVKIRVWRLGPRLIPHPPDMNGFHASPHIATDLCCQDNEREGLTGLHLRAYPMPVQPDSAHWSGFVTCLRCRVSFRPSLSSLPFLSLSLSPPPYLSSSLSLPPTTQLFTPSCSICPLSPSFPLLPPLQPINPHLKESASLA